MVNIFYIFCNPVNIWNLKKADCMRIIKQDGNRQKLIDFACLECESCKADLFVFDTGGNISLKYVF
jgi:hypothetical protein